MEFQACIIVAGIMALIPPMPVDNVFSQEWSILSLDIFALKIC